MNEPHFVKQLLSLYDDNARLEIRVENRSDTDAILVTMIGETLFSRAEIDITQQRLLRRWLERMDKD